MLTGGRVYTSAPYKKWKLLAVIPLRLNERDVTCVMDDNIYINTFMTVTKGDRFGSTVSRVTWSPLVYAVQYKTDVMVG